MFSSFIRGMATASSAVIAFTRIVTFLRRFFAQDAGGFFFARRREDDLPALSLQLFGPRTHPSENFFHVITTFARDFLPNAVYLREDFVFFMAQLSSKSFGVQMMRQV
jgi:hypothetical protein